MIKNLKSLLLLGKPLKAGESSSDLRGVLSTAQADIKSAEMQLADLDQERRRLLIEGDDAAITACEGKIEATKRALERLTVLQDELRSRIVRADADADEAERLSKYNAAMSAAKDAKNALQEYTDLAIRIANIIEKVAVANVKVIDANKSLPRSMEPLSLPELELRGLPSVPSKEVRRGPVQDLWFYTSPWPDKPVEQRDVSRILQDDGRRTGTLEYQDAGGKKKAKVRRRRGQEIFYSPFEPALSPAPLSSVTVLPSLECGRAPIWEPQGSFDYSSEESAAKVLDAARELRRARSEPPAKIIRSDGIVRDRWEWIDE